MSIVYKRANTLCHKKNANKVMSDGESEKVHRVASGHFSNIVFSDETNFPINLFVNATKSRMCSEGCFEAVGRKTFRSHAMDVSTRPSHKERVKKE